MLRLCMLLWSLAQIAVYVSCIYPVTISRYGLLANRVWQRQWYLWEKSTNRSSNTRYHSYDLQTGSASIREALYSLAFWMHLSIWHKEGKAYPFHLLLGYRLPLNQGLVFSSLTVPIEHWGELQTGYLAFIQDLLECWSVWVPLFCWLNPGFTIVHPRKTFYFNGPVPLSKQHCQSWNARLLSTEESYHKNSKGLNWTSSKASSFFNRFT